MKYILKQLAKLIIRRFQPQVIAITGSVGKTSAKEAIYAVLKNYRKVRKSEDNLNNELGVLLAIIGPPAGGWKEEELKSKKFLFWFKAIISASICVFNPRKSAYPEILILEYTADRSGDIKYLLEIAKPFIGIITAVGEIEAVSRERAGVVESLRANGFAVLNFDNEAIMNMKERTRAKIITFGFNEGADVKISGFENRSENDKPIGVSFKIEYAGSFVPVVLKNVFGEAQAYAAAVAACVGLIFDLNLVEISEPLSSSG